jgi:hypothetical protein
VLNTRAVDRVGTRRILVCPYCYRLQAIIPQPALFDIACKHCDRVFRVTETGAVAPVKAARAADGAAPGRSPGVRLRAMLGELWPSMIVWVALAAVVAAACLVTSLNSAYVAGRRPLLEGSMTAPAEDMARVLARERDRRREALARYDSYLAAAAGDASLQALWYDLKRRDSEEVRLLEHRLAEKARDARTPAEFLHDQD